MGRERGVASARSQPLGGAAAHAGTPVIETSTSKPPWAFCWEATARRTSLTPANGAHGGRPRWQPAAGLGHVGGRGGAGRRAAPAPVGGHRRVGGLGGAGGGARPVDQGGEGAGGRRGEPVAPRP